MKRIHLIGIGGSGLSAMAKLLLEMGYSVSGSDLQVTPIIRQLEAAGAQICQGHRAESVLGADVVLRSSAIQDDNPEVRSARKADIPVMKRAEFIGRLMEGKTGIAIAGTHGKTTTTAMISWMLAALGLDPSYLIGGVSINLEGNAHSGNGEFFVIEADEYDRMFLGLYPELAIVTNIEHDHPDCFPTGEDYFDAFLDFVANLSPDGKLLVCADDPGGARLLSQKQIIRGATFTYGIPRPPGIQLDYQALGLRLNANGFFEFDAVYQGQVLAHMRLAVPGEHNVRNSLAALSVAHLYGLPIEKAAKALSDYSGTHRRFEIRGEVNGVTIVDDYAHHPSEIRATLAAAKQRFADRQLWAVWQPHTFSRTREYYDAFASAFGDADHVIVTDIFAAREVPDSSLSANALVAKMKHTDASYIPDIRAATEYLLDRLQSRDVLLVLSAGDAEKISGWVLEGLSEDGRKRDA